MFSQMGGQRVEVKSTGEVPLNDILHNGVRGKPDISALAGVEPKKASVLVWHYHDDDLPGPDAAVTLTISHLPFATGDAKLTQYRIDAEHSNAFNAWQRMGSPTAPNDAQLVQAGQLDKVSATETVHIENGQAVLSIKLPRQAVSLVVLSWD
jgi:xylan 1,4-beta-xylosidase